MASLKLSLQLLQHDLKELEMEYLLETSSTQQKLAPEALSYLTILIKPLMATISRVL